jgi:hypothetical protein
VTFIPDLLGRTTVECAVDIDAPCQEVFDVIHDYGVRLRWDTLLSEACIVDGSQEAGLGVRTLCVGRSAIASIGMETVYISFDRPRVAAVRMKRGPWFIADFAASIRHTALSPFGENRSRVIYKFRIVARPRWLHAILDPLLRLIFQRETVKRLASLKRYIEGRAVIVG